MAAYHAVMVHFPIALWMTATLAILLRAVSDGPLAKAVERALVPLLGISLIFGIAAFAIGLFVWPWETISSTPLGRNHVLTASWTVAYWAIILFVLWRRGAAVWTGMTRWIVAGLALLGSVLLGITGTLGGHLVGIYTEVSDVLRLFGWEVFTTYYVPDMSLIALVVAALLLLFIGFSNRRNLH